MATTRTFFTRRPQLRELINADTSRDTQLYYALYYVKS